MQAGKVLSLKRVCYVVMDEADIMFDMGFAPQIGSVLAAIRPDRQLCLFSATFPKSVEQLARESLKYPVEVMVGGRSVASDTIEQFAEVMPETKKFHRLLQLLGEWIERGKVLVFVDTQQKADEIYEQLTKNGYTALSLHGGKEQDERDETLQNLAGNSQIHIPIKVSSLKTIFVVHRLTSSIQAKKLHSVTNRSRADLTEYYFSVGSTRMPQKPIKANDTNCAEVQIQLQKAFHSFGKKQHAISYYQAEFVKTGTADDNGAFLLGMDFESFSGKSTVINQGISTISQNFFRRHVRHSSWGLLSYLLLPFRPNN